jgi:outer membrane protein assembly factor BamB
LQQNLMVLAGLGLVVAGIMWLRNPRVPAGGLTWWRELPLRPAAPPALTAEGSLLVPTGSGQVRLVSVAPPGAEPLPPATSAGEAVFTSAFPMQAAPLVVGSQAYLPSQDGTLYAIDWKGRKQLWQVDTAAAQTTSPAEIEFPANGAVPAQRLIVCGNDEGSVVAVDATTGRRVWARDAGGPVGESLTSVLLEFPNGQRVPHILVPIGAGVAGRGGLVCLDARNGQVRWRFPRDGKAFAVTLTAPAVETDSVGVARRVFLATDDGVVYALDATSGLYQFGKASRAGLWKSFVKPAASEPVDTLVSLRGTPAYFPELHAVVVGGNDGAVRALDSETGAVRWTFDTGYPVHSKPRLLNLHGRPAVLVGGDGPELWAIDAENGHATNRWKLAGHSGAMWAEVAPDGREVLVLDEDARLQSISLPEAQTAAK